MPIDLYYTPRSAPCRAVQMLAKTLGLELNLKDVDLKSGEQLKPEYVKVSNSTFVFYEYVNIKSHLHFQMNPQHCVPTLNDDGVILWESRAILSYLANKYGKTDSLYPKDPVKRAKIDQKLYFDMDFYSRFKNYYMVQIFEKKPADPEMYKKVEEAFAFLEGFLEGQKYAVGENLTIADFPLLVSVSNFELAGFPVDNYTNIKRWYATCRATVPGWDINVAAMKVMGEFLAQIKK